jgi:hypothetical protein
MITAGHGGSWNVEDQYPELDQFFEGLRAASGNKGGMFANIAVRHLLATILSSFCADVWSSTSHSMLSMGKTTLSPLTAAGMTPGFPTDWRIASSLC